MIRDQVMILDQAQTQGAVVIAVAVVAAIKGALYGPISLLG